MLMPGAQSFMSLREFLLCGLFHIDWDCCWWCSSYIVLKFILFSCSWSTRQCCKAQRKWGLLQSTRWGAAKHQGLLQSTKGCCKAPRVAAKHQGVLQSTKEKGAKLCACVLSYTTTNSFLGLKGTVEAGKFQHHKARKHKQCFAAKSCMTCFTILQHHSWFVTCFAAWWHALQHDAWYATCFAAWWHALQHDDMLCSMMTCFAAWHEYMLCSMSA